MSELFKEDLRTLRPEPHGLNPNIVGLPLRARPPAGYPVAGTGGREKRLVCKIGTYIFLDLVLRIATSIAEKMGVQAGFSFTCN